MKILQQAVSEYKKNLEPHSFPPCFESQEQYQDWSLAEREAHTQPIRRFVCRDCDACYQAEMTSQNRCLIPEIPVAKIAR